jgi:LEA14-like dessication related protein
VKGKVAIVAFVLILIIGWNIIQLYAYRNVSFDVRFSGFKINWFLFIPSGVTIYFTIVAHNPSFVSIYIPNINGRIYLEDIFIDNFYIEERRVPAGGAVSQAFSITASVETLPALGKALGSIVSRGYATIRIDGDARIRLSLLPIIEIAYYVTVHFSKTTTVP